MTDRKPPGVGFETWIDRQIRETTERGQFDNLPGAGKPIPGAGRPYDEMWWIKQKLREEELSFPLPGTLALRKKAEEARARAVEARTEAEAREIVEDINDEIRDGHRKLLSGPPLTLSLLTWKRSSASGGPATRSRRRSPPPNRRPGRSDLSSGGRGAAERGADRPRVSPARHGSRV
ncbi:DUF1992 domain-containing protein [Nonomuraea sp. NPDC046570]|uniref:DnaJ family domain-containing protein n=1 Tax=Nonomuraea sp. NPDC046570 TaxID=3155255 RepID=UPI0033C8CCBE